MIRPDVVLNAKLRGYDSVKYVGKWRGYDAYQMVVEKRDGVTLRVGMPHLLLVKGVKVRRTTTDECRAYMREQRSKATA